MAKGDVTLFYLTPTIPSQFYRPSTAIYNNMASFGIFLDNIGCSGGEINNGAKEKPERKKRKALGVLDPNSGAGKKLLKKGSGKASNLLSIVEDEDDMSIVHLSMTKGTGRKLLRKKSAKALTPISEESVAVEIVPTGASRSADKVKMGKVATGMAIEEAAIIKDAAVAVEEYHADHPLYAKPHVRRFRAEEVPLRAPESLSARIPPRSKAGAD